MAKPSKLMDRTVSSQLTPARVATPLPAVEQATGTARELRRIQRGKTRSNNFAQAGDTVIPTSLLINKQADQVLRVPPSLVAKVRQTCELVLGYVEELSAHVQARHIAGDCQYTLRQAITEVITLVLTNDPPA